MTGNIQERRTSRPGRWFRRAFMRTSDVESQHVPRLGSVSLVVDNAQMPQNQHTEDQLAATKTKASESKVAQARVSEVDIPSGEPLIPGLPSPTPPPVPYGLQQQEANVLEVPRPVLTTKNSSAYYLPCDIYRADMNTDDVHGNDVYANHSAALSSSSVTSSAPSEGRPLAASPTPRRKRHCTLNPWTLLKAGWAQFTSCFDPQCFWKMIDIREIFFPFTWKRYITLTVIGLLIGALIVTQHYFHWMEASMAITRSNMLPVLVLVLGLEPIMITIIIIFAKVPDLDTTPISSTDAEKTVDIEARGGVLSEKAAAVNDHRTALVIPCHNSDHEAMLRVLESAYPHFRPCDIFVIDNARSMHPKDSTFREFIRSQHEEINYIWSPVGSKNYAQLVGAVAAEQYEFIMTVDDDVCIPASFRPPIHKINDVMKGVAFPLKATNAAGKVSFGMVAWQDCEYRMAGLTKLAEEQICGGAVFPHGAGWFCERATMIDLISNYHSLDFIAEDVNTGISMMRMKKSLGFDATCVLETEVPTTVFGKGLNWYHQRVRSWEMGRHGRLLAFFDRFFCSFNGLTNPIAIFAQKFILFYSIACIIVDWVRIPVIVTMGANGAYWRQAGLLSLVSIFPILWFKYISCRRRPDLQPTFWGAVTIPVYKQLYYLVSVIGGIRALVYYIGGHKRPLTVKQMIKAGDERVLWLDPRWATNKGYLADEGENLRLAKEAATASDVATLSSDAKRTSLSISEKQSLPTLMGSSPPSYSTLRPPTASQTTLDILPAPPRAWLVY
ncbi:glycosyltransferase family 2 protein [Baudoinia panamericana UAMH 10762]|uniref:Glycosyltransferase family 2 protein n=1 Tax=Baudoinia panamericana (strain UAMH 10762) TaxID=717646 RepID=M2N6H6_BAUPA|nr:glycosyltransferase family 2 protein [Baudoinia panamericana UAMH 10762]EMC94380.1 glycosyltransferase family 2 protein [Baudoinia panamericana UAMH 10762]